MDLGTLLKFKPWGAVKLAKGINGVLVFTGIALEVWDSWEQAKREEEFHKSIEEMVKNFNKQRSELLELINGPQFIEQFFADYVELQNSMQDVQQSLRQSREQRQRFHAWRKAGEVIDGEFTEFLG